MIKLDILDKEKNISMLSFSTMQMPSFRVDQVKGWVEFGKKNDFPNQLLRLYEEHSEHAAIVGAKANYLLGGGIKAKDESQQLLVDEFLKYANRYEDWNSLNDKVKVDIELFNACYFQVITDLSGTPKDFYHLQYSNCRVSKDLNTLYYSENWLDKKENVAEYSKFQEKKVGTYFIRLEFYKPVANKLAAVYPLPQYIGCIKDISTDIDISTFNNNYVANGFSAGTLVTFFNGEPTADQKREIKRSLLNTHSSPDKAGSIVINYATKDGQAASITALNVDDLDKKFEFTSKRALDKILRGHNVTNPELFGVKTEGQLGTRVSLKESYELMINTYTKPRQKVYLNWMSEVIFLCTGQTVELEIKQLEAIGLDLSADPDLSVDERRILKGYEPLTAPKLDATGQPIQASEVNSTLTNLTGRQFQGLMRIVSKFDSGKLSKESAIALMMASFGITKEDALTFLNENDAIKDEPAPVKMSSQTNDFIIAQFEAIENTTKDLKLELVSEDNAHIHNSKDALKFETEMYFKFADNSKPSFLKDVVSGLLGKIGIGNKSKSNDEPTTKTEILTKYYYELKDDAPALKAGGSSRPFCVKMMAASKKNDGFLFEQIDSVRLAGLSNGMPEVDNIWDYRGGFYTKPGTNDTDPFCRHFWKSKTFKVIS